MDHPIFSNMRLPKPPYCGFVSSPWFTGIFMVSETCEAANESGVAERAGARAAGCHAQK